MSSEPFSDLSNEDLRQAFRKHTMTGLIASLTLLVAFVIVYFVPLHMPAETVRIITLVIAAASVIFAVWYHLGRRRYYKEFRRRNMSIRG